MLGHLLTRFSIIQKMAIEVVEYSEEYKPELAVFCNRCRELGWTLYQDFEAMKLYDPNVLFWLIFVDNVLACVCGAQELYAKDADGIIQDKDFRIFFTGNPAYVNIDSIPKISKQTLIFSPLRSQLVG